jgi:hypothetical protein
LGGLLAELPQYLRRELVLRRVPLFLPSRTESLSYEVKALGENKMQVLPNQAGGGVSIRAVTTYGAISTASLSKAEATGKMRL